MRSVLSDPDQSIPTPEPRTHALLAADQRIFRRSGRRFAGKNMRRRKLQKAAIDARRPIVSAAHMKRESPIGEQRYSSGGSVRSQATIAPTSSAVMCLK
jgi:hypothetical protein